MPAIREDDADALQGQKSESRYAIKAPFPVVRTVKTLPQSLCESYVVLLDMKDEAAQASQRSDHA
jgi:hypothetical protein